MTERNPLLANRVRKIAGSFAFVEHRFLRDQFWHNLAHHELILYFFLVLVSDRQGVSFYGFDKICSILGISVDHFLTARDGLIEKVLYSSPEITERVLPEPHLVDHGFKQPHGYLMVSPLPFLTNLVPVHNPALLRLAPCFCVTFIPGMRAWKWKLLRPASFFTGSGSGFRSVTEKKN